MIKNWYVRSVFFLDRHRIWACLAAFAVCEGALGYLIFPRIMSGAIDSRFHMYEEVIGGLVLIPLLGMAACKIGLEMLTEAIVKPKIQAANEREKSKKVKASQASDPRFEGAFSRDEVEPKYSRARFEQINEDKLKWWWFWRPRSWWARWKLSRRIKQALWKRIKK